MLENWTMEKLSGEGYVEVLTCCPGRTWRLQPVRVSLVNIQEEKELDFTPRNKCK